jgi:hypothetical protein
MPLAPGVAVGAERPLWPTMIFAFTKTREQVRGERHEGAHGQQFRYVDQDLDGHAHDPANRLPQGSRGA